jgi:hypothetical protein
VKAGSLLLAVTGVLLVVVGLGLMTVWEVELFRATTFDRDFAGLVCGTPLDNPGWPTGSPCHGAVNRQTGASFVITSVGVAAVVGSILLAAATRRHGVTSE